MLLVERDFKIFRLLYNWNYLLGRQIRVLAGFSGQRATDRRLKMLKDESLIDRKRILYGVAGLYTVSHAGRKLIGVDTKHNTKIRADLINHNISVVDTTIYIMDKYKIDIDEITSEKILHQADGFGNRKHRPDFVFSHKNKSYCVEVELSLKAKERMISNIRNNFSKYDFQLWIVPKEQKQIIQILEDNKNKFPNAYIILLEEVKKYVSSIK